MEMITSLVVFALLLISTCGKPLNSPQCGISENTKKYDGTDQTRILGGKVSNPTDWPFVVKITDKLSYCTATIIGEEWILSAAHCNKNYGPITVIVDGKSYTSNETYIHEKYNTVKQWDNDIMLIKLPTPLEFSKNVTNICLQKAVSAKNGDMAALAGFGKRFDRVENVKSTYDYDGIPLNNIKFNRTSLLHEVPVIIRDMEFCFRNANQSLTKICAGGEMQGITQGDSGGPLAVVRGNQWVQYGISSTVRFTGIEGDVNKVNNHGVFTRISYYCDWISKTTTGDVQCQ